MPNRRLTDYLNSLPTVNPNVTGALWKDGDSLRVSGPPPLTETLIIAVGDETTATTVGTAIVTYRMPYDFVITAVRASLNVASTSGIPTVDINDSGVSILSTKLTIDANEKTSKTAVIPPVMSDVMLADDTEITIDVDAAGTGATGLKVYITGYRSTVVNGSVSLASASISEQADTVASTATLGSGGGASILISDQTITHASGGGGEAIAGYRLTSAGLAQQLVNATYTTLETWCTPTSEAGNYEAFVTVNSGSLSSGTTASWVPLSSTQTWTRVAAVGLTQLCTFTVQIRRIGTGTILDTAVINLEADGTF